MTTVSFKDAAILTYMSHSKGLSYEDRRELTSGLSSKAKRIANRVHGNMTTTGHKRALAKRAKTGSGQ